MLDLALLKLFCFFYCAYNIANSMLWLASLFFLFSCISAFLYYILFTSYSFAAYMVIFLRSVVVVRAMDVNVETNLL